MKPLHPVSHTRLARVITGLVLFSLLVIPSAGLWSGQAQASSEGGAATVSAAQSGVLIPILPDAPIYGEIGGQKDQPKLDSSLAEIAAAARQGEQAGLARGEALGLRRSGPLLQVQLVIDPAQLAQVTASIDDREGEVTGTADQERLVQAWVPPAALEALAAHPAVQFIRRPAEAVLFEMPQAGAYTSEGLLAMNADDWHAAGITGTGVKIAVIDTGFLGYNALRGSDLPNVVIAKNFVDGENDGQVDGTTMHGTACAEIIYDLAPTATLYLLKIATNVDLQEAKNFAISQGMQVISTSLGFYNVTPGDGTGQFADMAQDARNAGILWTTAAGNDRQAHWGGAFNPSNPSDPNSYHQFSSGQNVDYFGPPNQPGTAYQIQPGYVIRIFLRWDDWVAVNQDYDLFIVYYSGSSWNIVASSTGDQNGSPGQTPVEYAQYTVPPSGAGAYGFMIRRFNSNRNVNLEAFAPKVETLVFGETARSIANLADAPDAMTVAAEDVLSFQQESYSSEGPANGPGGTASGGFIKPDISGYANVSTASYGQANKFNGTSAATPHVAGAAALVKSAFPGHTPDQVQSFLEGRAFDQGAPGMDNVFGWGRLNLGTPSSAKVWTGSLSSDWHTAGNWEPAGVPGSGDDVYIPNVTHDPQVAGADGAARNLTIDDGALLSLITYTLKIEGSVSNLGEIRQRKTVSQGVSSSFATLKDAAGSSTHYAGVTIQPTAVLTTTTPVTVTISGNAFCDGLSTGVLRCFDIQVAKPITATVTFYFNEGERNGETLVNLLAYHKQSGSGWVLEPGPYARGGSGDAQYVSVQKVDGFSPFALRRSGATTLRLPLLSKEFTPAPLTPTLNPIQNADGDGSYTVNWSNALYASSYTLQEDDNVVFASPTTVYSGAGTSWNASNKNPGTYYYRVRSSNKSGDSAWSSIASTVVIVKSGIAPGYWTGTDVEFYVTSNQSYVSQFSLFVYVAECNATYKITRLSNVAINNKSFSFSGALYGSGSFTDSTHAQGTAGLDNLVISGCGTISGGPWPWTATWTNDNQPSAAPPAAEMVQPVENWRSSFTAEMR